MKTDQGLQKEIMEELRWDPQVREVSSQIVVTVNGGMVTLSGLVDTFNKKLAAEKAAQRVRGVNLLAVDLDVKLEQDDIKPDIEIAEAVNNSIRWNTVVKDKKIKIKVENGWITLAGTVSWDYERKAAVDIVNKIIGVKGIINKIQLQCMSLDSEEIKNKISIAFRRSAMIDSANVKVEVLGDSVVLIGKVKSWAEKMEAENVAWSSPGVQSVESFIKVDSTPLFA